MRILLFLSDLMIPLLFFYIIGFGLLMKKDIYNDFVTGAFDGLKTVVKIMPTLIGLMTGWGSYAPPASWMPSHPSSKTS